jgi:hypothetical protein
LPLEVEDGINTFAADLFPAVDFGGVSAVGFVVSAAVPVGRDVNKGEVFAVLGAATVGAG